MKRAIELGMKVCAVATFIFGFVGLVGLITGLTGITSCVPVFVGLFGEALFCFAFMGLAVLEFLI